MSGNAKPERNRAVYEAREAGAKWSELARTYGICSERARQIWAKEDRTKRLSKKSVHNESR
jgi:transposase-like protein